MPIGHDNHPLAQVGHQPCRDQIAGPIEACPAILWVQFAQTAADRHVRAHDEHDIGKARVGAVVDFVKNAPCREHPHDRRLPRAGSHLASEPAKSLEAIGLALVARLVERGRDPLQKIGPRLGQEDDRFSRLALREEQAVMPPFAGPIFDQFARGPRDPRPARSTPFSHPGADQVHEF